MGNNRLWNSDFFRLGILLGLAVVMGVYLIAATVLITRDGVLYVDQARRIGHDPLGVARQYPPGYPFLVWAAHRAAGLFAGSDSTLLWVYSAQGVTLLCRVLALVPLYFLGRLLVGPRDSFRALLVLVILPYPARYGSDVLREWPYVLFLGLAWWLLCWGLRRRAGWLLGLAGLAGGLAYLIRMEGSQLLLYGLLGLIQWRRAEGAGAKADVTLLQVPTGRQMTGHWQRLAASVLLVAGFAIPAAPYALAIGTIVPHQLWEPRFNLPPVIVSLGGKTAGKGPLEFEVCTSELLELPVEVFDPQRRPLIFSLVRVPVGSRPVYRFHSAAMGAYFWTASEEEKNLLAAHPRETWSCEGIVYYAYAEPGVRAGLRPVHRFWSPARLRHFYTMDESEREAILGESASPAASAGAGDKRPMWQYEGVVFYAFPASAATSTEGSRPADTLAVCRSGDRESGYFWAAKDGLDTAPVPERNTSVEAVAWYGHRASEPPAGAAIEAGTFRWRPSPEQQGEYQMNVIVSNGLSQSSQLVRIQVRGPADGGQGTQDRELMTANPQQKTEDETPRYTVTSVRPTLAVAPRLSFMARLTEAVYELLNALTENLMAVFLAPWLAGLYYRLRYEARPAERVLVTALILVNTGMILARHVWIAPGTSRRYSVALLALTVFYIPVGIEVLARWLSRLFAFLGRAAPASRAQGTQWFHVLLAVGVVICAAKLIGPSRADKQSYRAAARWLRHNTQADDVIAVPDSRISFYADRPGLPYEKYLDPQKADYIVRIVDGKAVTPGASWHEECSFGADGRDGKELIIYSTRERKE